MNFKSDIELVESALNGEKKAFNFLVDKYYSYCLNKAYKFINDKDVAKDLVQNGLIEAYFGLGNLKNKNSFKQWLGGIINNICKSYLRANNKKYLSLKQYYEGFHDSEVAEEGKVVEIILSAVRSLEPKTGRVVIDFYYEGKSIQEICTEHFISAALVKVRLHRARKELKSLLETNSELKEYRQYFKNRHIMKEVKVMDMVLGGKDNQSCSVLLYEQESFRVLPIVISKEEAEAMLIAMKNIDFPRPLTFNLITEIIRTNNLKPEGAYITGLLDGVFISLLKLKSENSLKEYDSRPSDAITLALMFKCPIFVSQRVLDKVGFPVPEKYKRMTPQENGINHLSEKIENSLLEMNMKLELLKKPKSAHAIQEQVDRLMNYAFGDLEKE
jgi:uncharacterized protein